MVMEAVPGSLALLGSLAMTRTSQNSSRRVVPAAMTGVVAPGYSTPSTSHW